MSYDFTSVQGKSSVNDVSQSTGEEGGGVCVCVLGGGGTLKVDVISATGNYGRRLFSWSPMVCTPTRCIPSSVVEVSTSGWLIM